MIPYTRHEIRPEDEAAVLCALRSGYLTQGPEIEAFEHELAALSGAKYAVAVNSGTAALHLTYVAAGWKGRTVHCPAISFVATSNALIMAKADPRFVDCNEEDGLWMESDSPKPCEVPVALGGQVPEAWGDEIVRDACHGPLTHDAADLATCLSLHPAKHIACGEGGAILTNDDAFAEQCRLLRSHGRRGTEMVSLGYNYRLNEMSAALGRSQLTRYHAGVAERRRMASRYDDAFAGHYVIQTVPHGPDSARHLYQILLPPDGVTYPYLKGRNWAQGKLRERGIGTAIHYPVIPLQPYYRQRYGYREGMFPGAEAHAARTLSIPLFPGLTEAEQDRVIAAVLEVCG